MDSAIAGLLGALIGALASGIGVFLAQREETKRKLFSDLVNAGMKQWEVFHEDKVKNVPGSGFYSPEAYAIHLLACAPLISKADKLSGEDLAKEYRRNLAKIDLVRDEAERHRATRDAVAKDRAGRGESSWT